MIESIAEYRGNYSTDNNRIEFFLLKASHNKSHLLALIPSSSQRIRRKLNLYKNLQCCRIYHSRQTVLHMRENPFQYFDLYK